MIESGKLKIPEKLLLQISPVWFEDYCQGMRRSTTTVEKRIVALDALQTFISAAIGPELVNSETHERIKATLSLHIEQARSDLMAESAARVATALEQHDVAQIARLFVSLSRSGFWEALSQSMEGIGQVRREEISAWAVYWLKEKKQQGEQSSPYPDAIDFAAAGIDVSEYTAMTDLCNYISSL